MKYLDPILRPLARLAVQKGWLFPTVAHRLRLAFVDAAEVVGQGAATDSKISVLTGLQRRDIARLRGEVTPQESRRQPLAEIIALWVDDPAYDPNGIPTQGEGPSFATLARRVRQDVHPRTFLDVLVENDAVQDLGGAVRLKARSYRPLPGSDDQLHYLAHNVGDHLATAVSNAVGAHERYEMAVHFESLSADAITQLDALFKRRMGETLQEMDSLVRALPAGDEGPFRFRAGGYFFDDVVEKGDSDEA